MFIKTFFNIIEIERRALRRCCDVQQECTTRATFQAEELWYYNIDISSSLEQM